MNKAGIPFEGIFNSLKRLFSPSSSGNEKAFLSDYETIRLISTREGCCIYEVKHRTSGETRAIKKLVPKASRSLEDIKRELDLSFQMTHPNIARYYAFERRGNAYYVLMEFVRGNSLRQFLRKKLMVDEEKPPFIEEKLFLKTYLQCAQALQYIHSRDVLHLDIKPENIIVDDSFIAKILDFGISVKRDVTPDRLGGSVFYIAPEVVKAAFGKETFQVGECSDVYSLGATMYELATGRPPHLPSFFDNRTKAWVYYWNDYQKLPDIARKAYEIELMTEGIKEPPSFSGFGYSEAVRKVLSRSLEVSTKDRYSHMYEVVRDLKAAGA